MKNDFGVMQGRLLPKYQGRYQAHPLGYWQEEFLVASELGLDCIEFILDFNDAEKNPLLAKDGDLKIANVVNKTGVSVKTICADYFMEVPLHTDDQLVADTSYKVLETLVDSASKLGVTDIVIPCVDQSSLNSEIKVERFIGQIKPIIPTLKSKNINLSLETDLAPDAFSALLRAIGSEKVTVNYDIGNSAALGFNPVEELEAYGDRITDIHIKDRVLGGGPVTLGEGDADFQCFFQKLKEFDYRGPFIMQAYRDDEGVEIFKKQQQWILEMMHNFYED